MKHEERFWAWLRELEPARQLRALHQSLDEFLVKPPQNAEPELDPKAQKRHP
jgi:hypothetical protein